MELLTVSEAARISRMSTAWWRQRVFRKEINYLKIGRSVRIPKSTLDQILRESHVDARINDKG